VESEEDIQRIQSTLSSGDAVAFHVLRPLRDRDGVTLFSTYFAGELP
jgi:hypothetical protein